MSRGGAVSRGISRRSEGLMPGKIWLLRWRGAGVAAVWCAMLGAAAGAAPGPGAGAGDQADVNAQDDAQAAGAKATDGEAPALVKQLGDPDFKVREAAAKRLKDMGRDALPALTEALAQAKDPEVCSRADALMRR